VSGATRADLITALYLKLDQLARMAGHLEYSRTKVASWLPCATLAGLGADQLESLAALKGRFAEMQDHLAAAMRLVARIEEVNAEAFTYVVNFMEKIGVIPSAADWNEARALRNDAAHAYSEQPEEQGEFFNQVFHKTPFLFATLAALEAFCRRTYPEGKQ
jgi:hypothetical protein